MYLTTVKLFLRNSFDLNYLRKMCGTWAPVLGLERICRRWPVGAPGRRVGRPILRYATAATYLDARINWRAPAIYYIILDGYARSEVMRELFDFDNTAFLERLERKGFFVARGSNANYCQTPLSRSSSLIT